MGLRHSDRRAVYAQRVSVDCEAGIGGMTLTAALEKADRQMDEISDRIMCDCEAMYVDMGATSEELAAGLERERRTIAEGRRQIHESIRVAFWTGFDSPSSRVH